MNKTIKGAALVAMSFALVLPGMVTPASAKSSKVKVVSTKGVAKKAYHGSKGNLYSSAKLTHRKYQMKKYKYTTWTASKQATIKRNGKKATLTYIKSGKKAGWIYKKYLTAGKAPYNKPARLKKTYLAYNSIIEKGTSIIQNYGFANDRSYDAISNGLRWGFDVSFHGDGAKAANIDKEVLVKAYKLFRGRMNKSERSSFDSMAKDITNYHVTDDIDSLDGIEAKLETFSSSLSDFVADLS
ncbi:hypothetical protein ACFQET_07010 [Levilactobacillus tangyuanensis]|uniref:D-alanyl-D-alanine carboxypeptidase n=1 Tax=Levilactobacillus tangyuanensis TaxID=2486021 RepID=A0ABW1TP53_9LACO|nr:hypothetical protein [Levilactobacillus tangyuanensis]